MVAAAELATPPVADAAAAPGGAVVAPVPKADSEA